MKFIRWAMDGPIMLPVGAVVITMICILFFFGASIVLEGVVDRLDHIIGYEAD